MSAKAACSSAAIWPRLDSNAQKDLAAFAESRGTSFATRAELRILPRTRSSAAELSVLWRRRAAPGIARYLGTAQRTWLGVLVGRRLAHRPARTPTGCGLAKSAFFFERFARFFDALRWLGV
jgi:hypothetical protein